MNLPPDSQTIPDLIEAQADYFGEREAVVSGDMRLSYQDLHVRSRLAAKAFLALGVRRGTHVGILMDNRPEWIIACLGLQTIGATVVGLNTWATPREMEYAIGHAEVDVLVAIDQFRRNDYRAMFEGMQPWARTFPRLRHVVWFAGSGETLPAVEGSLDWKSFLAGGARVGDAQLDTAILQVTADDVALLLYTSGSTAAPKGLLLQHRKLIVNAWNIGERMHVSHEDRLWLAVSLFWSFGSVNALPNILSHGACVVLQDHFDAAQALALIERERCSVIYGTPNMVLSLHQHPDRSSRDLRSLRTGAMIGTPEQLAMAVELGATEICNVYGLSETYGNCAVTDASEPLDVRLHCSGQPLPGVSARICHIESGAVLPAGEVGEIRVKGMLFSEYFKDEARTRESFDSDGYFLTGDLGMQDESGRICFRGRLKEMVKSGGINIAPVEVEETLMRHPGVRSAYVIGVPDAQLDEVLVAIVIPHAGATPSADELKQHCQRELAAYKVPARFRFATDAELPLTTTGKLQKMKLHTLL